MSKIYIGRSKESHEEIYLTKHSWNCGWYWGFGYLGNEELHYHFSSYLKTYESIDTLFSCTKISITQWWVVQDLFKQAYTLKEVASVYRYGGPITTCKGITDILYSKEKAAQANKDLELVLDTIWTYLVGICGEIDD